MSTFGDCAAGLGNTGLIARNEKAVSFRQCSYQISSLFLFMGTTTVIFTVMVV
jgi:hypothetical protein